MNKYVIRGLKKLFSLTKTKNRLAVEHGTTVTKPNPIPLVKYLSGESVDSVQGCMDYTEELRDNVDLNEPESIASTTLQLMDIIEGVKYGFEPPEFMAKITPKRFQILESKAVREGKTLNLLIMTESALDGLNLYVGSNPPEGALYLSGVPTSIAVFVDYAFCSHYFSRGLFLRNVSSVLGRQTLINNVIHFSLGFYGAKLYHERSVLPGD